MSRVVIIMVSYAPFSNKLWCIGCLPYMCQHRQSAVELYKWSREGKIQKRTHSKPFVPLPMKYSTTSSLQDPFDWLKEFSSFRPFFNPRNKFIVSSFDVFCAFVLIGVFDRDLSPKTASMVCKLKLSRDCLCKPVADGHETRWFLLSPRNQAQQVQQVACALGCMGCLRSATAFGCIRTSLILFLLTPLWMWWEEMEVNDHLFAEQWNLNRNKKRTQPLGGSYTTFIGLIGTQRC